MRHIRGIWKNITWIILERLAWCLITSFPAGHALLRRVLRSIALRPFTLTRKDKKCHVPVFLPIAEMGMYGSTSMTNSFTRSSITTRSKLNSVSHYSGVPSLALFVILESEVGITMAPTRGLFKFLGLSRPTQSPILQDCKLRWIM